MNPNKRIKLRTGDHLVTPRMGYTHHGLYIGDGTVIHYLQDGVCLATLKDFCDGATYHVKDTPRRYSRDKCVERAYSRIGEDDYNLLFNNCESFVNWCLNGDNTSEQVTSVVQTAGKIATAKMKLEQRRQHQDCTFGTGGPNRTTVPEPIGLKDIINILSDTDVIADMAKTHRRGQFGVPRNTTSGETAVKMAVKAAGVAVPGLGLLSTVSEIDKVADVAMRGVVGGIETGEEILDVASKVASGVGGAIAHGAGCVLGGTATAVYDFFDLW